MNFSTKILYLSLLLFFPNLIYAQKNKNSYYRSLLNNGKTYNYIPSSQIKGTPFLFVNTPKYKNTYHLTGKIVINEDTIHHVLINYDILSQKLVLKIELSKNNTNTIEVSDAWIKSFSLNNKDFIYRHDSIIGTKIYQVLGDSGFQIYYYWYKNIKLESGVNTQYFYTKANKKMYLLKEKQLVKFKNNRTFLKLFSENKSKQIKSHLKQRKLNIKKANDNDIIKLINFCNTSN